MCVSNRPHPGWLLPRRKLLLGPRRKKHKVEPLQRSTRGVKVGFTLPGFVPFLSPEVTKVRRNLFNQELASPSKKAKMPRSHSVSAVEGLKRKRSHPGDPADLHTGCWIPAQMNLR